MADLTGMMQAAAGAGEDANFIEDVFSTYLYVGNDTSQTITNNIDLSGKGGLVWTKNRQSADDNGLFDTQRGANSLLYSNSTTATLSTSNQAFLSNGFTLGSAYSGNRNADNYVSWTFRKQAKFFDVVTYTGDGANRTIAHNLGSVPGSIWVKRTDTTGAWQVYHRANTANPETDYLVLNTTAATADSDTRWNDTLPTSTVFSLGTDATVNASAGTYVAYLFAHDAGGFGLSGTDNVISCGSFTTDGSGNATVSLGYEPQWILLKTTGVVDSWYIYDTMRGITTIGAGGNAFNAYLRPNSSGAETTTTGGAWSITSTGFRHNGGFANRDWIYIAIRRGPMKTPTSGTSVYNAITRTGTGAAATVTGVGFAPDVIWASTRDAAGDQARADKLRGFGVLRQDTSDEATPSATELTAYGMDGVTFGGGSGYWNGTSTPYINWFFQRAPSFMDVVCYTGTGSNTTQTHNLGVVPELIIVKGRSSATAWDSYSSALANTEYVVLNTTAAKATGATRWNSTTPTASVFSIGTSTTTNANLDNYVAYLFATVAGVSKVGSYTGNGTSLTVTTGFQPRFILVKRTDSTGNWIVGDSARGLVAGDDPFLLLNSTAAETTNQDWVDVSGTGFTVNETGANANVSTATYIFLAIS